MPTHAEQASVRRSQCGLSLIELMVAITLGLLVLAGVLTVFSNSQRARVETEKTSRQIENGRYAMQLLSDDLQMAGFLAEFDPTVLSTSGFAAMPDPCATDLPTLQGALPLHVQGIDNLAAIPNCLADVKAGTDIIVVRRASTCVPGANCDAVVAGLPYFQASLCTPATGGNELAASPTSNADYAANWYALDFDVANLTRRKTNCTAIANVRRYRTHIYFVANNSNGSDGIPTLMRAELGAGIFSISPLVEGIDQLHFEYGIDTSIPGDGVPDAYTADPSSYNGCAGTNCVENWRNIMTVKVHLLARNSQRTTGYVDGKTYVLGKQFGGNDNALGPYNDSYKRHAYSSVVRLSNPAGRRE